MINLKICVTVRKEPPGYAAILVCSSVLNIINPSTQIIEFYDSLWRSSLVFLGFELNVFLYDYTDHSGRAV
jgi:hypothetical protein